MKNITVGSLVETIFGAIATVEAINGETVTVRFHHNNTVSDRWIAHFKPVKNVRKITEKFN